MIKLGVCSSVDNAALLKEIGFDYLELGMSSTSALSEEEFEVLRRKAERAGLPVLAMNGMLPSDFHLCSDQLDTQGLTAYLHKAFSRAQALGVKTVVFGSGGARRYPLDMEYALAMDYLVAYLRLAGPLADNYGLSIAVEPLREQECNIINSVMEARQLAKMANQANVGVLADLFHMARPAAKGVAVGVGGGSLQKGRIIVRQKTAHHFGGQFGVRKAAPGIQIRLGEGHRHIQAAVRRKAAYNGFSRRNAGAAAACALILHRYHPSCLCAPAGAPVLIPIWYVQQENAFSMQCTRQPPAAGTTSTTSKRAGASA